MDIVDALTWIAIYMYAFMASRLAQRVFFDKGGWLEIVEDEPFSWSLVARYYSGLALSMLWLPLLMVMLTWKSIAFLVRLISKSHPDVEGRK